MNSLSISFWPLYSLLSLVATAISVPDTEVSTSAIFQVYTNNIRYDAKDLMSMELPWAERKVGVVGTMLAVSANMSTVFALQEVTYNQLLDIKTEMNWNSQSWAHIGEGRDGGVAGEYNPILYNVNEWDLLSNYTRWLSETPGTPSAYKGKCFNRIVSIGIFRHKSTGSIVNVLNTHFCHKYEDSRQFQAYEILKHVDAIGLGNPTIVAGDLNSERTSVAYSILSDVVKEHGDPLELPTVSGFQSGGKGSTIDYVFSKGNLVSLSHAVLDNMLYDQYRFSDHRPVLEVFELAPTLVARACAA
ncbi:uncharacterized protein SPAPADRAFT_143982 [Spathaspora passalidarum NRRL Y-27907]|uniref:Endonuclease/exonuclease/phosphatase domain-containing protein n=1 Tax=Spathaspora passalidarum (strain NRRL Y-27907 / 11-Y1) TaxID=619300 RepID=G3AVK3_SPAPN|nr:uncharacterized protein SPAPADRAFT_143982 [Spathaspora passalidarum NRRL Y-27907]EGW29952.1 hypothetical protein SPAPADRAFT_143982 [Spathaspora passalidarum NRRL Y-27907]